MKKEKVQTKGVYLTCYRCDRFLPKRKMKMLLIVDIHGIKGNDITIFKEDKRKGMHICKECCADLEYDFMREIIKPDGEGHILDGMKLKIATRFAGQPYFWKSTDEEKFQMIRKELGKEWVSSEIKEIIKVAKDIKNIQSLKDRRRNVLARAEVERKKLLKKHPELKDLLKK